LGDEGISLKGEFSALPWSIGEVDKAALLEVFDNDV
jgi:hypothetical protein